MTTFRRANTIERYDEIVLDGEAVVVTDSATLYGATVRLEVQADGQPDTSRVVWLDWSKEVTVADDSWHAEKGAELVGDRIGKLLGF